MNTAISGRPRETVTHQLLQQTGISSQNANLIDNGISTFATMGGAALLKISSMKLPTFPSLRGLGKTTAPNKLKIERAERLINEYLGESLQLIRSQAGDLILMSMDGGESSV